MDKERLGKLKQYYSFCSTLGEDVEEDIHWMLKIIEQQQQEIERLEKFIDNLQVVHFTELQTERAENARYGEALQFYGNVDNYDFEIDISTSDMDVRSVILNDCGEIARKALKR